MGILDDILFLNTFTVGGTVALIVFLGLATFSWRDRVIAGGTWFFAGLACTLIYAILAVVFSRSNAVLTFLMASLTGCSCLCSSV